MGQHKKGFGFGQKEISVSAGGCEPCNRKIVFNPCGIEFCRQINCKLMSALVLEQAEHVVPGIQPE